jgi:hypothetical protein
MAFGISSYISSAWSEVDNSNFYEGGVGRQVWANLLAGNWVGRSWAGAPLLDEALAVTLTATTAGTVTGNFTSGAATGSIRNGVITYKTTTVRAATMMGAPTTADPISGIHVEFDWTLGAEAGKGFLDSDGERRLVGGWGTGTSNSDRGTWHIART